MGLARGWEGKVGCGLGLELGRGIRGPRDEVYGVER